MENGMKNAMMILSAAAWCACSSGMQEGQAGSKSALEADPSGWVDVFPDKDLKGWKRVPIDPLQSKAVWKHSSDGKLLLCDGTGGVKEVLINDEERGDGIFHVEWRWGKEQEPTPNYNGGIYLRSSADGKVWIQAQVRAKRSPRGSAISSACSRSTGPRSGSITSRRGKAERL